MPIVVHPKEVRNFAREGFATVIRLPLRNEFARQTVYDELKTLRNSLTPLLLFLRRLRTLTVTVRRESHNCFTLTRSSTAVPLSEHANHNPDLFTHVELNGGHRYLVAWHWISERRIRQAIDVSIERKRLHPSWGDWQGDGEMAVAVRLDDDSLTPQLYTFLPLGKGAEAPFHGYLHGSFSPKADRISLDADVPINSLYINDAIGLCVRTILAIRQAMKSPSPPLSQLEAGRAIVDLLCWENVLSIESGDRFPELIGQAFTELGCDLSEAEVLLTVPHSAASCWARPRTAWRWDGIDLKVFSAQSMAEKADADVLSPNLGATRLDRLGHFLRQRDDEIALAPTDEDLAGSAERIANALWSSGAPIDEWRIFYDELSKVLKGKGSSLAERKILLCNDGELRQAVTKGLRSSAVDPAAETVESGFGTRKKKQSRRRSLQNDVVVFSPSRRLAGDASDDLEIHDVLNVPPEIMGGFAFLTDEIDWYEDSEAARHFLEEHRLVRSYDAQELVAQVSTLVRNDRRKGVRRAALAWVFQLYFASKRSRPISLQRARLFVPTVKNEWIDATDAIFSSAWPAQTLGRLTENNSRQNRPQCSHQPEKRSADRRLC